MRFDPPNPTVPKLSVGNMFLLLRGSEKQGVRVAKKSKRSLDQSGRDSLKIVLQNAVSQYARSGVDDR